ncbi:MAG: formylglycine-generating enzyme family protein [Bacteroidota bacterium]
MRWIEKKVIVALLAIATLGVQGQGIAEIIYEDGGLKVGGVKLTDSSLLKIYKPTVLFSFELNGNIISFSELEHDTNGNDIVFNYRNSIHGSIHKAFIDSFQTIRLSVIFENPGQDTLVLSNLIPFGVNKGNVYTFSAGENSRFVSYLARPAEKPISVFLPGEPGQTGYSSVTANKGFSVMAVVRKIKDEITPGDPRVSLAPGETVQFYIYFGIFEGAWQNGLISAFNDYSLFDMATDFRDNQENNPVRGSYISVVQYPWNNEFYDGSENKYTIYKFLEKGKTILGGYDIYGLDPGWRRIGLDDRSWWDLYNDLPWGIEKIKELSDYAAHNHTSFFITWHPQAYETGEAADKSFREMNNLMMGIKARGIIYDTYGASPDNDNNTLERLSSEVPVYYNKMPLPSKLQMIKAARLNETVELKPLLNLGKLMNPSFPLFNSSRPGRGHMHRDIALSFFNGHGTELNMLMPGRFEFLENELYFLGKTSRILRENSDVFTSSLFPLVKTNNAQVHVNRWISDNKEIYTILNLAPGGANGPLFSVSHKSNHHYVDLWNHEEIQPLMIDKKVYLPATCDAFNKKLVSTTGEGSVGCIGVFPELISLTSTRDSLFIDIPDGNTLEIWKTEPLYKLEPLFINNKSTAYHFKDILPSGGKIILRLLKDGILMDERVYRQSPGTPVLINSPSQTSPTNKPPERMVEIPEGIFVFNVNSFSSAVDLPDNGKGEVLKMPRFFMDKFPVTNEQFFQFLLETRYKPKDPVNFLKHWENGMYPDGQGNYPVVWISIEDAKAYATWAGKRLPTEVEWQYAAQGTTSNRWPWGEEFHATKCNNGFGQPTPVDAFPKGESVFGVADLVGNIWQLTSNIYDNGTNRFVMIRGGSFYKVNDKKNYLVTGGPRAVDEREIMLLVSPGFNRSPSVGFRCVQDAE